MTLKAESNIVTEHGVIKNGETFNPDRYKMPKTEVERLIGIGSISRVATEAGKETPAEETSVDDSPDAGADPDSSEVDTDDRRKQPRKATK